MKYYRLYEKIGSRSALGYGPSSGRWNESRTPLIYCASSIALTMMEHYAIKGSIVSDAKWELAVLEINYDIPKIYKKDLPRGWDKRPHSKTTQSFGTSWAENREHLCLKIPSARIPLSSYPKEHNLIINPLHPEFPKAVKIVDLEIITFKINKSNMIRKEQLR